MNMLKVPACSICGEPRPGNQPWILVTEGRWQDKLRILHWDDYLAAQEGAHCACSAAHLQELVVHWMATGSLDHPFAEPYSGAEVPGRQRPHGWTARDDFGSPHPKPIGELTVHRESMPRVLSENPQSLQTILDALLSGLQRESPGPEPKIDWGREAMRRAPREI
jgi:hypothetical protein